MLCAIHRMVSMQCRARFITGPVNGYFCPTLIYKNRSAIGHEHCIGLCISTSICWAASYNNLGRYCLLARETCVVSDLNTPYFMVNLRPNETQHLVHWASFNSTIGRKQRNFPPRTIKYKGRKQTVARALYGPDIVVGWATDYSYRAYLIGWGNRVVALSVYEIVLVENGGSTSWVPYTIGEPMPRGVVVAGVDRVMRNKYIIRIMRGSMAIYGSYTEGDPYGYYEYYGVKRSAGFSALVELF